MFRRSKKPATSSLSRATNTVQGDVQSASVSTFMAINGDGFFVVEKAASFSDNRPTFSGVDNYTRRGDFQLDQNGYLVNGAGNYLMGIPIDSTTGNLVGSVPQILQFQNGFLPAQATTEIDYRANLPSYPQTIDSNSDRARLGIAQSVEFQRQPDQRRVRLSQRFSAAARRFCRMPRRW